MRTHLKPDIHACLQCHLRGCILHGHSLRHKLEVGLPALDTTASESALGVVDMAVKNLLRKS